MAYRNLEINVISAKDLSDGNLFSKVDVYTYVSISGEPHTKQKSPVDNKGGKNPTWNFAAKFTIDESVALQDHTTVVFQLKDQQILGDKEIGEVHVPIKELLENVDKPIQFVSYQVRKPSGRAKGQLNISYKFSEKFSPAATISPAPMPTCNAPPPYTAPIPGEPYKVGGAPMTAYHVPAAVGSSSSGYPQSSCYPPQPDYTAYPHQPPAVGYPPQPAAGYGYPPPPPQYGAYPPPPHLLQPGGYAHPPAPAQLGYGYPPPQQAGYGYLSPQQAGYGYPHPQQGGYAYPPAQPGYGYTPGQQQYGVDNKNKSNKNGMGGGMALGAGLLGGAIGGMLIGDMISDAGGF